MSSDGRAARLFDHGFYFPEHIGKRVMVMLKNGSVVEGVFRGRNVPAHKNMSVSVYVDIGKTILHLVDYEVDQVKGFYY